MQQQVRTVVVFGAIIAIASGLTGAFANGLFEGEELRTSSFMQSGLMTGHVELTVRDMDGNINEYRQSDNIIVHKGEECAALLLFGGNGTYGSATGDAICGGLAVATKSFNIIAIGNQTVGTNTADDDDIELVQEHNMTSTGFQRAQDISPEFTFAGDATPAQVVLSNDFTLSTTDVSGTSLTVTESGLFNSTSQANDQLFARQTFASVTVDDTESLTVEWTINIGGTNPIAGGTGSEEL